MSVMQSSLSRALYLLVFACGWLLFTRGLPPKRSRILSSSVLIAGLLLLLFLDHGGGLVRTGLRYLLFTAFFSGWSLLFLDVRPRYALWLSAFFVILLGICFSVVQIFFVLFSVQDQPLFIFCTGLLRIVSVALLGRCVIRQDGSRDVSIRELFLGLFPAISCFLANLILFEILGDTTLPLTGRQRLTVCGCALFFGVSAGIVLIHSEIYFALNRLKAENEHAKQQLREQYRLFLAEKESSERVRALRHDIANHLHTIEQMASAERTDNLREYACQLSEAAESTESPVVTGDATLDALLSYKASSFAQKGIRLQNYLSLRGFTVLSPMETCTLFANALDNAAEAVAGLPEDQRLIRLSGGITHGTFVIKIVNPYSGERVRRDDLFATSKSQDDLPHGYGLSNMQGVVRAHGGTLTCRAENGVFTLICMIPAGTD
ncbi:MAG: GHKL domain-containing protein [Clostridia bacterium]|nr:GHKL domain-containing protein [Clostridia bacterium]